MEVTLNGHSLSRPREFSILKRLDCSEISSPTKSKVPGGKIFSSTPIFIFTLNFDCHSHHVEN